MLFFCTHLLHPLSFHRSQDRSQHPLWRIRDPFSSPVSFSPLSVHITISMSDTDDPGPRPPQQPSINNGHSPPTHRQKPHLVHAGNLKCPLPPSTLCCPSFVFRQSFLVLLFLFLLLKPSIMRICSFLTALPHLWHECFFRELLGTASIHDPGNECGEEKHLFPRKLRYFSFTRFFAYRSVIGPSQGRNPMPPHWAETSFGFREIKSCIHAAKLSCPKSGRDTKKENSPSLPLPQYLFGESIRRGGNSAPRPPPSTHQSHAGIYRAR